MVFRWGNQFHNRYSGIGSTYYFSGSRLSGYVHTAVGLGDITPWDEPGVVAATDGAFMIGGGYEFSNRFNLEATLLSTLVSGGYLGRELLKKRMGIATLDHAKMRSRTLELLKHLDLELPSLDRPVRSYSGGQRQAIAICRLLLEKVNLIIMDEPMAALGIDESNKVLRLISSLRNKGEAIVVISHNLDHVFSVADKVSVMKNGALVDVVRTDEVGHDDLVTMIVSGRPYDPAH